MNLKCPNCGTVFSQNAFGGNARHINVKDVIITCPKCGYPVNIPNGDYKLENGKMFSFLSRFDIGTLDTLRTIAENAEANYHSPEQFLNDVSIQAPESFDFLKKAVDLSKDKNFRFWIKLFITALLTFLSGEAIKDSNIEINIGNTTNNETNIYPQNYVQGESYSKRMERIEREKRLAEIKEKQAKKLTKSQSKKK